MKVLHNAGPVRLEDHDDKIIAVHAASGDLVGERAYTPGKFSSWMLAHERMSGFLDGWTARKNQELKGKRP